MPPSPSTEFLQIGRIRWGSQSKSVALVVWLLSRSISLAVLFIWTCVNVFWEDQTVVPSEEQSCATLTSWLADDSVLLLVSSALENLDDAIRVRSDKFLIETFVVEFVLAENAKGQSVPPSLVISKYIEFWQHRLTSDSVQEWLARLTWHENTRRDFCRQFKARWGFHLGQIPYNPCPEVEDGGRLVVIYLKWLRYVINIALRDKFFVILNMDETNLTNLTDCQRGYVFSSSRPRRKQQPHSRNKDRTNSKVTLLGVIADQPELQPHLPQVILPRYTSHAVPPRAQLQLYALQGYPMQFWHGTAGSTTPHIFKEWILRVRRAVHSFNPALWIVLLVDCHSSHLDQRVVAQLRAMKILAVFIPAKMTWLLQPLDVCVFGPLKKNIRLLDTVQKQGQNADQGAPGAWVLTASTGTKRTLCQQDWSDAFDRLGAGLGVTNIRRCITRHVEPGQLYPALPSRQEFALVTSRVADTDTTRRLHQDIVGTALIVRDIPPHILPPTGARSDLPPMRPARKRQRLGSEPVGAALEVLSAYQLSHRIPLPLGGIVGDQAVQVQFPPPVRHD